MQAVLCPVCKGAGRYKYELEGAAVKATRDCHGCGGKGWVTIGDRYPVCPTYPTYPVYPTYPPYCPPIWTGTPTWPGYETTSGSTGNTGLQSQKTSKEK